MRATNIMIIKHFFSRIMYLMERQENEMKKGKLMRVCGNSPVLLWPPSAKFRGSVDFSRSLWRTLLPHE